MSEGCGSGELPHNEKKRHRLSPAVKDRDRNSEGFGTDLSFKRLCQRDSFSPSLDMDQPADLSMKKERRELNDQMESPAHSSHMSSSSSKTGRDWYVSSRDLDVSEPGIVLDLASKGPSRSLTSGSDTRGDNSDVIVLSDEDVPKVNGHMNGFSEDAASDDDCVDRMPPMLELKELSKEDLIRRERLIMKLKENLRSEEMKLVLLKKLQLSHQMKENIVVSSHQNKMPSNSASRSVGCSISGGSGNSMSSTSAPPPLLRTSMGGMHKQMIHNSAPQMMVPPLVRPHSHSHGPPPLLMSGRMSSAGSSVPANVLLQQGMMRGGSSIAGRLPVTTPPNVVLGYPIQSQSHVQSGPITSSPSPSLQQQASTQSREDRADNQTPAQRQAAAKLALRKQLEKTLLQIPPPKPPPPELHFIPNPSNTEFIYLVGLEAVVNFITEGEIAKEEEAPRPFGCIQCNTDFTPVWKWENPKKGSVICELCVTSNIKKALKAEHTNRLKTAFVKALQQEQEIEQRMSQVSSSPPTPVRSHTPTTTPSVVVTSAPTSILQLPKITESLRQSHSASVVAAAAAAAATASANLTAAHQQLLRLPQHQPLPAHMLAPLNPFLAQAYQYQVLGKNPVTSAELQRQYLLDMIPPRSLPQGTINWKT